MLQMFQALVINTHDVFLNPATGIAVILLCITCIAQLRTGQVYRTALHLLAGLGALLLFATWLALGQHIAFFTVGFLVPWDAMPTPTVPMWQMRLHSFFSQAPFVVYLIPAFLIVGTSAWLLLRKVRRASTYARAVEQLFVFSAVNLVFIGGSFLLFFLLYSSAALWREAETASSYTDMLLPLTLFLALLGALLWAQHRLGHVSREANARRY